MRRHPRVGVLVQGLRAAGDEVDEVNVPLALDTAGRVAVLRQPWRLPVLLGKLARCWALLVLRTRQHRYRSADSPVDAVLVGYLGHFDVRLARWLFPGTPIVLDHLVSAVGTARDRGLGDGGGVRGRLLRAIDDGALRRADVVLVDTAEHLAGLPAATRDRGVVVPVGAGAEWFEAGARTVRERWCGGPAGFAGPAGPTGFASSAAARLRVVFVGLFTPLHGTRTLGAALATLAADESVEVTVVGTGQDHLACRQAAAGNPRVTWYDWVPSAELPAFVARHHVALGIFGDTEKARRVVPTKVFQAAAAGCAIVTSDTAPQRRALGDAALFVPPGDVDALGAALRELAGDPDRLARLRRAARRRAVEGFWPATVVAPLRRRGVQ
ncbi:glycosyltransferase [Plantactinospora sp. S1510]|uniref:Glycosyltransferase n=1 Tax=Plantactinospora alkalitolerans TaxID=2789879 RepID=A0ABS0GZ35_9ACTN|nr:glycosyltransferase [Plantactinospora alkalitolerans]